MQEGLALVKLKYKNEWKNYYNTTSSINFVYPFTGTENTTFGVISPSNDKSGRSFPFIMFSNIKKNVNDDLSLYLIPSAYKEVFYSLMEIVDANKLVEDTSGLKSLTDNVKLSDVNRALVLDDYKKFISETKLCDILDSENENPIHLNNFLDNKLKIFEHFIGINFPTNSNQQNNSFIISYYVQLLQKVFKNSDSTPGIFWTQREDKPGFLFLSFIKPTPKDFINFLLYFRTSTLTRYENTQDNKKVFRSVNSIFRDNSIVNSNISLDEFLNSIRSYLN